MPESDESIVLFLSGGLIKGVGEIIARRIVEQFHADSFSIIENNPRRLAQIKGISPKMAGKIHEQYMGLQTIRGVIISLQNMGLSIKEAMAAYEAYGQSASFSNRAEPLPAHRGCAGHRFCEGRSHCRRAGDGKLCRPAD